MNTEFSRLLFKRSTQAGVVPTINTGSTFPNDTWLNSDIMIGEGFINTVDDRMWIRTDNGIVELALSGISSSNYFTTGATLVGSTLVFDRNDTLSAYTVDLSTLAPTGGTVDELWVSGSTGTYSMQANNPAALAEGNYAIAAGTSTASTQFSVALGSGNLASGQGAFAMGSSNIASGDYSFARGADNIASGIHSQAQGKSNNASGITSTVEGMGNVAGNYAHAQGQNTIASGDFAHTGGESTVASGSHSFAHGFNNSAEGARSVVIGGQGITGTTADTVYVPGLNIRDIGAGTSIINLGLDSNGAVVTGSTFSGDGVFLPLNVTAFTEVNFSQDLLFSGTGSFTNFDIQFQGASDYSRHKFNLVQNSFEISDGTDQTYFTHNGAQITFTNDLAAGGEATTFSLGNRAFTVSSNWSGFTGIRYLADYSANYTNRSLVDKEYVDSAIPTTAPYDLAFAASDEVTVLATGTSVTTLYAPRNFTVTKVKVSLTTSGSTTTTVDVNVNGTSMLSAPISLASGVFVNSTTSLATSALTEDNRITVDIDAAGTDAAGLKVYLIGNSTL